MGPEEFLQIVLGLPEVTERESYGNMIGFRVRDKGFCYLDEAEGVVMLKATREEQGALVAEDPDTFAPSWASGRFAWLKIKLAAVDPGELNELVTEAWRLSAPKRLAATLRA
ncbi:MmcQ/YjbR family DNA-binding protein [Actinomadura citrea]|uniref:MmcQ/YjbR family DNA-binding protein n=1 Tax=Actinomadura TaxID=1988 RepID=UPI002E29CF0F|nr:MmcQ/YjbR family DNA-binding protein [Actinomadura citrea]